MPNYWLTTHWPPRKGQAPSDAVSVWLPDGREQAGRELKKGDLVLIYQSRSGRVQLIQSMDGTVARVPTLAGAEALIAMTRALRPFHADPTSEPETYADGTKIWWRWRAPLEVLSRSGNVPRVEVCKILGYSPGWSMRGFGDRQSGLKRLSPAQYKALEEAYVRSTKTDTKTYVEKTEQALLKRRQSESPAHRALKEFVATHPDLLEPGLIHLKTEYPFVTADRADIVLLDQVGRPIGVEIELEVNPDQLEGLLQAIKYRRMLEVTMGREPHDSRSFLVAHSTSPPMKSLCSKYQVECFEVPRNAVAAWTSARKGQRLDA